LRSPPVITSYLFRSCKKNHHRRHQPNKTKKEGETVKTSSIFPSNFLRASDLQGRRIGVVIEDVVREDVGEDKRAIMSFKNKTKRLILNKTNLRTIEEISGTDETDNWRGLQIVLYPTKVDYQGQRVDAIRVDRVDDGGDGNGSGQSRGADGGGVSW